MRPKLKWIHKHPAKVNATAAYLNKLFDTCSKDKALTYSGPKYDQKTEDWHFYIKCSQCNVGYTLMECESDGGTNFPYSFGSFVKAHSHPITTVSANTVFSNDKGEPVFAPYPNAGKEPAKWQMDKAVWDKNKKEFAEAMDKADKKMSEKAKPIKLLPLKVDDSAAKEWSRPCKHYWVFFEDKYRCMRCLDTQRSMPEDFKPEPVIKPAPVQVVKDPEGRKFR